MVQKGIHPTAIISDSAKLGKNVEIQGYVVINSNVAIGDNSVIGSHSVIGASAFSEDVKQNSGLVIGQNVWIGSHVNVQCGTKAPASIGDNCRINHGCRIGHDVKIEENCEVGLGASISGHSKIEAGSSIGPNAVITNRVKMGKRSRVGIGSLVLNDIPTNSTVIGSPAEELSIYKRKNKKIRNLINEDRKTRRVNSASGRLSLLKPLLKPLYLILPKKLKYIIRIGLDKFNG